MVAPLPIGVLGDLGDSVKMELPLFVVMVAVPHDVVGIGAFALARWVIAQVGLIYSRCLEAIWRTDAASNDGIENAPVLCIAPIIEPCTL